MKILRIRLRNLASLAGTHSVDFTREPLASAGLFSISGPTGSGKSTLLDALCLALYERTPRLASARGDAMAIGADVIHPDNPANLLRRGTAEGFAEVAFVGVDGQPYTARWSVRRARQRIEGSLQKSEMAIYRGNVVEGIGGEVLQGGRKTEVLQAIEVKVGLTFAQFTRAVLLAQNEFAVFLKADDRERALILQALTGSHRFERLSIAAFERERREQGLIRDIEARMQGQVPLAPDLRAAAEQTSQIASEAVEGVRREVEVRTAHVGWFERLRDLESALNDAQRRHEAARLQVENATERRAELDRSTEVLQSARVLYQSEHDARQHRDASLQSHQEALGRQEFARLAAANAAQRASETRERLQRARAERDAAMPTLQQARILDAQILPAATRLQAARQERLAAEKRQTESAHRIQQLTDQRSAHEKTLESLELRRAHDRHLQPFLPEAAGWIERLGGALRARGQREEARSRAEGSAKTLRDLVGEIERRRPSLVAASETLSLRADEHARCVAALEAFDPAAMARERLDLDAAIAVLSEARNHLGTAQLLGTQIEEQTRETAQLQLEIDQQTQALADLQQRQIPVAEATWLTSRDLFANAQSAVEKAAGQLRAGLRQNQPCPVCGALEHPFATHAPEADAALDSLRSAAALHQKTLEDLRTEATRLTTLLEQNRQRLLALHGSLAQLQQRRADARSLAFRDASLAGQSGLPEPDALEFIEARSIEVSHRREQLRHREELQRRSAADADVARREVEAARKLADSETRILNALERDRAAANAALETDQLHASRCASADESAFAPLKPLLDALPESDRLRVAVDPLPVLAPLQERLQELAEIESAFQKVGADLNSAQVRLEAEARELELARSAAVQTQEAERVAADAHSTLLAQRRSLLGGLSVEEESRRLDGLVLEAERTVAEAADAEVATGKVLADAMGVVRTAEEALALAAQRATSATASYDAWLAAFSAKNGIGSARAYVEEVLARGEAWFSAERAALAALDQAVGTTGGERTARTAARDEHLSRRPTEDAEHEVVSDLARRRVHLQEAEDQFAKAKAEILHDDLRRAQSAELLEQLERQRSQAAPWEQLNALIGSADGARFRAIAQRHTLDLLLLDANAQLDRIAPRYRLERLPDSLNLIVVDRDMGDERRGVHSLSGGESFLVSLGLALGLASLTSSQIRIESLFIDEGFGSLDQETLNTAMGALMQLEAQGRKVGIISHVTEMADAIPVQIQVVRGRSGASRLVVPGQESVLPAASDSSASPGSAASDALGATRRKRSRKQ